MAKAKTEPIDIDAMVAGRAIDLGLDPELPSDEYSDKIRFQQSRRQSEAEDRSAKRKREQG